MTTLTETPPRITGGVDTHRDLHVVATLDERGGELGVDSFPTTPAGYRQALRWLRRFGEVERVGVEGTGSYGAGLTRYLQGQGVEVIEISCPNRQRRRNHGKSDPVDAVAAAKAVISGEATIEPKTRTGNVEAIRALRTADRSARHARVKALNQMRASSGTVVRKRLNRGGNRQANHALWRIVMVRLVSDPATREYMERRTKEGLFKLEAIRCLKRYVARELYPLLAADTP